MKLDLAETGRLTSVFGILLCFYSSIIYQDGRHDSSVLALTWEMRFFWLGVLGMVLLFVGAIIAIIAHLRSRKLRERKSP